LIDGPCDAASNRSDFAARSRYTGTPQWGPAIDIDVRVLVQPMVRRYPQALQIQSAFLACLLPGQADRSRPDDHRASDNFGWLQRLLV
jgi:hypothetical protein